MVDQSLHFEVEYKEKNYLLPTLARVIYFKVMQWIACFNLLILTIGDIVGIFTNSSSLLEKDQICSGIISRLKAGCIEVALDLDTENIELNDIDSYKILKLANDVTYRRLKQ